LLADERSVGGGRADRRERGREGGRDGWMEGGKEVEGGERSQAQAEGSVVELQAESPTHPPTQRPPLRVLRQC